MNYRIENKEAFRIVGAKKSFSNLNNENTTGIPLMWKEIWANGMGEKICAANNAEPKGMLGVCSPVKQNEFDYYIACASDAPVPDGMSELTLPASKWAVFECIGPMPDAIQAVWKRIFSEWLPSSGYEHAGTPDFEWYSEGENDESYFSEVWIPVVKSEK